MNESMQMLCRQLEEHGLQARVVRIDRLADLRDDIRKRREQGDFDAAFYDERLTYFTFAPPGELPAARSIIVVAMRRPQTRLFFHRRGRTLTLILPPTYLAHNRLYDETRELLERLLAPRGYHVVAASLPQKDLSVRSGLAEYGRNNVTYISGWGSFFQPAAYFSDLPCDEDAWRDQRMLPRCETCRACIIKCPTQAITDDRFLVHAERCIVFHNERAWELPFPSWIDPKAHNCIIGCMTCQTYCPEDKPLLNWFQGDEQFDDEETSLLLAATPRGQLPRATMEKLERLELLDDLDKIPRNLSVFFDVNGDIRLRAGPAHA